jgi:mono/diheme cytochrome c family protein
VSARLKIVNRRPQALSVAVTLAMFGSLGGASAQNVDNGRHLSERWCVECHAITPAPGKSKAHSFAAIAAKEKISAEMIASFLRLPHATMPNVPLRGNDAQDIAAFIMSMKK